MARFVLPDALGIAAAMYVGLAWHFWNTRWHRGQALAPAGDGKRGLRAWERAAILVQRLLARGAENLLAKFKS